MAFPQLKLIQSAPLPAEIALAAPSSDPTRRLFEHWLFMAGRSANRCKLGPTRRQAISAWLQVYDEETLTLAIEGHAADAFDGLNPAARAAVRDLEWLFKAGEGRIERYAEEGERLRAAAQAEALRQQRRAAQPADDTTRDDPAAAQAAREAIRAMALRMRGGG